MIAVVGTPAWRAAQPYGPAGRACEIAVAAAAAGSSVEMIGRIGDDAFGDQLLIGLARASVGHAAVLRDPARPTPLVREAAGQLDGDVLGDLLADPVATSSADGRQELRLDAADAALGLRYLTGFDVLVVTDDVPGDVLAVSVAGADFAGSHLVVLVEEGSALPELPHRAIALGAPRDDDGAFGAMVGRFCAELDRGVEPASALRAAAADGGWEAVPDERA